MPKALNIKEDDKPFVYSVIQKRIEHCFTFKIEDERLLLFLTQISQSPGKAILYLWYLQYWCFKNNKQEVDLDSFCEIFPMGFPDENTLHNIWDSQKVSTKEMRGSDNLVDYSAAGTSIQFQSR